MSKRILETLDEHQKTKRPRNMEFEFGTHNESSPGEVESDGPTQVSF